MPDTIEAPTQTRWGATPQDWENLSVYAGLVEDLLPVVSDPGAPISPTSKIAAVGKTPSEFNGRREVRGIANWTERVATFSDIGRWENFPDYGICLQTRQVRAIDVDVDDFALAQKIYAFLLTRLERHFEVTAPVRTRSNSGKFLVAIRVAPGQQLAKRRMPVEGGIVEFLATGQQFVACGTHPSGARYEWGQMGDMESTAEAPFSFPEITLEQFEALWNGLREQFATGQETEGGTEPRARGADVVMEDPLADFLRESGLALSETREGGIVVGCPWEGEHSGGKTGDGSSVYFPAGSRGYAQGAYVCLHAHCSGRGVRAFSKAVGYVRERGEDETPEAVFGEFETAQDRATAVRPLLVPAAEQREQFMQRLRAQVMAVPTVTALERELGRAVALDASFSDSERERVAEWIKQRAVALDTKLSIAIVRRWVAFERSNIIDDPLSWVHLSEDLKPLCTLENVAVLLRRNNISVRYNMISREMEISMPGRTCGYENQLNTFLTVVLSLANEERMLCSATVLRSMLAAIAAMNQYNPVAEWIGEREWDGVDRLPELMKTLELGAGFDARLAGLMIRKWMIQGVAVVLAPDGRPVSTRGVLVFSGPQNIGKSRWIRRLVNSNPEWYIEGHSLDAHNKDSVKLAITRWVCELGELGSTFRKSDLDALKAFLTREVDRFRLPYAPEESKFQRRTMFYASVNDDAFLPDLTGNTRFWVVPVVRLNHDHGVDMQQVWAQMAAAWRSGEQHWLTEEEMGMVNSSATAFQVEDPIREALASQFSLFGALSEPEKYDWAWLSATEILNKLNIAMAERATANRVGRTLRTIQGLQNRHTRAGSQYMFPLGIKGAAIE